MVVFFLTFTKSGHVFIFPNILHLDVFCFLLYFALRWHYITHRSGCGTSWSLIQFCIQQSHSGLGEFFLAALHHFSVWLFFFSFPQSCRPLLQRSAAEQRMRYEKKKWSNDFKILSTASWTGSWKVRTTVNKSISISPSRGEIPQ